MTFDKALEEIEGKLKGLVCLVPKPGAQHTITCHEKTLCDCEVLTITGKLLAVVKEMRGALEKYKEGGYCGENCDYPAREALTKCEQILGEKCTD